MPKINTYTDNATIEDVDALLTYDPAGNGATKLTTFARIASWISSKLSALTKKASIASTDQILMVDGAASPAVTKRIDYNVLAKAIIEQYASSSLAGANQSVKTAIDALNSKSFTDYQSGVNSLLSLVATLEKGVYNFRLDGAQDSPVSGGVIYTVTKTHPANDTRCSIVAVPMATASPDIYTAFVPQNAASIAWQKAGGKFAVGDLAQRVRYVANNNAGDSIFFNVFTSDTTYYKVSFGKNGSITFQYFDGSEWTTYFTK